MCQRKHQVTTFLDTRNFFGEKGNYGLLEKLYVEGKKNFPSIKPSINKIQQQINQI